MNPLKEKTKLSIVIPTLYQDNYYTEVVNNIDNLKKELDFEVEVITIENKLVNEAWNEWVEMSSWEYIMVINDDIIIHKWTIEKMIATLEYHTVSCPYYTLWADNQHYKTQSTKNICWFCYMFKKDDANRLFPIPSDLKLWYGDNRIYNRAMEMNWVGWLGKIHHRESKTILSPDKREYFNGICDWDRYARESFYKLI